MCVVFFLVKIREEKMFFHSPSSVHRVSQLTEEHLPLQFQVFNVRLVLLYNHFRCRWRTVSSNEITSLRARGRVA